MKTKKRFLSILLSLVLVLGLMMGMSTTAYAESNDISSGLTVTLEKGTANIISVMYGSTVLIENTDYTVTYKKQEEVVEKPTGKDNEKMDWGSYKVVIEGKGSYTGTYTEEFYVSRYPGMDIGQQYTYDEIVSKRINGSYIYFATYNLPEGAFNVSYSTLEDDYKGYLLGKYAGSAYSSYHTDEEDALNKESKESIVQKRKWTLVGQPANDTYGDCIFKAASDIIPEEDDHVIYVNTVEHGNVISDKELAKKDATVTLTVSPDEGYKLETIIVTKSADGSNVSLIKSTDSENTYTFVMPDDDVTVAYTFKETTSYTVTFKVVNGTWSDGSTTCQRAYWNESIRGLYGRSLGHRPG